MGLKSLLKLVGVASFIKKTMDFKTFLLLIEGYNCKDVNLSAAIDIN